MNLPEAVRLHLAGRLDEAEAAYRSAIAATPPGTPQHAGLLRNYGFLLHQQHRFREAIAALQDARPHMAADAEFWAILGQCARECDDHRMAVGAFKKAAALAPEREDFAALLSVYLARMIPGWHLPMLADTHRNAAFEAAIARQAAGSVCTLDIGTGSGLLAMLAARHGARRVIACEANPNIAETAQEIVMRNGFADRITVIPKRSTSLQPGADLPQPADLIVSEILDAGLLGEGVLPALRDARARLATAQARMIPARAAVFAQAMMLPELRSVNPVRQIAGFDLSPFDRFRNRAGHGNLRLEQAQFQALSAPFPVADVDFAAPPDWRQPARDMIDCTITSSGVLHAFVLWFDLWLDAETCVTTAPGHVAHTAPRMVHWGQATIWQPADLAVQPGQTIRIARTRADTYFDLQIAES